MTLPEYITLNGSRYTTAKRPEEAQARSILRVGAKLARLPQQRAIAQAACSACGHALADAVNGGDTPAQAPKNPRAPRKTQTA